MNILLTLQLLLACLVVAANVVKEGKHSSLDLQTGEAIPITYEITAQNLIAYVRPPNSKVDSPGKLVISKSGSDQFEIDAFYQSALFKSITGQPESLINVQCEQGPCQAFIYLYGHNDPSSISEKTQIVLTKSHPIQYLTLLVPDQNSYHRIICSLRSDDETLLMEHVGLDIFGDVNFKSQIEKTRMFFVIESQDKQTCSSCSIDIIITADNPKSKSILFVQRDVYQQDEKIVSFDVKTIDYLTHPQTPNYYKIQIPEEYSHIILKVNSFGSLMPRIYGQMDQRPGKQELAEFDSSYEGEFLGAELDLVFQKSQLDGDFLFLAISGIQGLIQLEFKNINQNPQLYIHDSLFSQIQPNQIHYYSFCAQPLDDDNGQYIEIDLAVLDDDDDAELSMYIQQCTLSDCTNFTFEELKSTSDASIIYSSDKFMQKITFKPHCTTAIEGLCWYTLAIQNQKGQSELVHYSLSAKFAQGLVKLKENQPFSSMIIESDVEQLVYYYQPIKHDASIIFSVSSPHVAFIISNEKSCQPVEEKCSKWKGGMDSMVTLRGDDMVGGAYYIGVIGLKTTAYNFAVTRTNKKSETIIELKEGQSYQAKLSPALKDGDIMYFSFELTDDDNEDSLSDIEINLQAGKFRLGIAVNVGKEQKLPSVERADFVSFNNYLIISEKLNAKYHGAVQYLWNDQEDIDQDTAIPFTLSLATSKTIKSLTLNEVFFDSILPERTNSYYFLLQINATQEETLLLTKAKIQPSNPKKDLKIYISALPSRQFEGDPGYEVSLKSLFQSTYQIDFETQKKLCQNYDSESSQLENQEICQFFIFVENPSKETQRFALTLWKQGVPIDVHEGHALTFNMENIQKQQSMKFIYSPVSYKNEIQIFLQSYYGSITFQVDVLSGEGLSLSGIGHNIHSKQISPSALEGCKPTCLLAITLQSPDEAKPDDTFTIMVSQMFMEVNDGQPIETVVNKPKYFIYSDLASLIKDSKSQLSISVHELSGSAVVCLSFADNKNLRMPNILNQNCDFTLLKNEIQLSSRNITNLLEAEELSEEDFPILILEISSSTQTKVILTVDKLSQNKLILATPTRVSLGVESQDDSDNEQSDKTYNFYNYQSEDLEFKISRLSGFGYLEIFQCKDTSRACQKTQISEKRFLAGQTASSFLLSKKSKDFCQYCYYFLHFSTTYNLSLQALATITTKNEYVKLSQGLGFVDYLEGDDVNQYRVSFDTQRQIEVYVNVFGGSPQTSISFLPSNNLFGPYRLKDSNQSDSYYAIIPPIQKLVSDYNISFKSTLAPHLTEDDLYISLSNEDGVESSNYTITVYQGSGGNLLQDGLITPVVLSKINNQTTLYYYHQQQHLQPKLIVNCEDALLMRVYNEYNIRVSARVAKNYDKQAFQNTTINLTSISSAQQFEYSLPEETGLYEITIQSVLGQDPYSNLHYYFDHDGKPQVKFDLNSQFYSYSWNFINRMTLAVSISASDLELLNSRSSFVLGSVYPGQMKFYELQIPDDQMAVQLQNCQGALTFSFTQKYEHFIDQKFKKSVRTLAGQSFDTVLELKPGPVYFAIKGELNESIFRFATQHPGKVPFPHGRILAGGQLSYDIDKRDSDLLIVNFSPLKCIQCDIDEEDNSIVEYQVVWASSEDYLNQIGKCDYYFYGSFYRSNQTHFGSSQIVAYNLSIKDEVHIKINVEEQSEQMKIFVSIRAQVRKFNNEYIDHYTLSYSNLQVYLQKDVFYMYKHKRRIFIFGASMLVTIAFFMQWCCSMMYFLRKLRSIRNQQLEISLSKQMQEAKEKKFQQSSEQQKNSAYGQFEDEKVAEQ